MRIIYFSLIVRLSTGLTLPAQPGHGPNGLHRFGGHHGSNGLHGSGGHQFHQAHHHRERSLTSGNIMKREREREREQQRQEQRTNGAGETQTQDGTQSNP